MKPKKPIEYVTAIGKEYVRDAEGTFFEKDKNWLGFTTYSAIGNLSLSLHLEDTYKMRKHGKK